MTAPTRPPRGAVAPTPGAMQWALFCALTEYVHGDMAGLLNCDEYLRKVCHANPRHWPAVKRLLFASGDCF